MCQINACDEAKALAVTLTEQVQGVEPLTCSGVLGWMHILIPQRTTQYGYNRGRPLARPCSAVRQEGGLELDGVLVVVSVFFVKEVRPQVLRQAGEGLGVDGKCTEGVW